MARQQTTNPDTDRLTPQQGAAVDLLAVGTTVTNAAEAVGVARQTLSEWLNRNSEFRAALNLQRMEIWRQLADRLRALVPKAVDVLERSLDEEGKAATDAAVQVLKACGIYGMCPPSGYMIAEDFEIAEREAVAERRRRLLGAETL